MVKDEKSILWAERIQELHSSGQSMRAWCLEHKISTSTMGYWIRKLEVKEQEKESEPVLLNCQQNRKSLQIHFLHHLLRSGFFYPKISGLK